MEQSGEPVGYLQFCRTDNEVRVGPCLGQVDEAAVQILLGYLFDFEGVERAMVGNALFSRDTFQAPAFHILFKH